jgi:hypothetical protein
MRPAHSRPWLVAAAAALLAAACTERAAAPDRTAQAAAPDLPAQAAAPAPPATGPDRGGSPGARWDVLEMLRRGAEREQHPSDGGGRAWLERSESDPRVRVGAPARLTIVYEVGPLGIARDGGVYLQVSPFWGWSTPQTLAPEAPGYTEVEAVGAQDGVALEPETLGEQLLVARVVGRPLVAGDRIRFVYGAGPAGASVDRYAERESRFWIAVDGDGDGARTTLPDSPGIDVGPGEPARLLVVAPSVARPGERIRVAVSLLDALGNAGLDAAGAVRFDDPGASLELPREVALGPGGRVDLEALARAPGVVRLRASGPFGLEGESNPIEISAEAPRVLWADLHGHSALSDGTGLADDYFEYARDVAALDVVALSDHDHWGILPLDANPDLWRQIRDATRRFHEPGRFVTLLAYEWTSWVHGHRHVLYFDDEGEIYSSIAPEYESPLQLWKALEGRRALTVAHHSAGGPIATNWEIPPDPRFEPVTEIVSVHGSSEAPDSPTPIYAPVAGNFVRDALARGYRFGFVGSGDSHDGHPGLAHLAGGPGYGGVAAILSEERTRDAVLAALRERRVYASNGPRILLRAALGGHRMGATVPLAEGQTFSGELYVSVLAPEPLATLDLIRSGRVVDALDLGGRREVEVARPIEDLAPGEYVYVRAVQQDGGAAWSSPIYVGSDESAAKQEAR